MPPRSVPRSQAHSQPVANLSQESRYFSNGFADHLASQNRGRLSPLPPRQPHPSVRYASPRNSISHLQFQQQPHPFFSRGPSAMGYIPQQALRYPRHISPREAIVPLRNEFSAVNGIHDDSHRPMALNGIEQTRPFSVPTHYMQPSQTNVEQYVPTIPRPTSVAHTDTQRLFNFDRPNLNLLVGRNDEEARLSSINQSVLDYASPENEHIPPKRILPFPASKQAKAPSTTIENQLETNKTKSLSPNAMPIPAQQVSQPTTNKAVPKKGKAPAPPLRFSSRLANKEEKTLSKRSNDASTDPLKASERRPKIRLVGGYADHSNRFSTPGCNASTSASTLVNGDASQGPKISQPSLGGSKGKNISGGLDAITKASDESMTHASPLRVKEISHLCPTDTRQYTETETAVVAPSLIPEYPSSDLINPLLSNSHDWDSVFEISQQSPSKHTPLHQHRDILVGSTAKRSASQATTVSTASGDSSHTAGDKNILEEKPPFNPMSMIDEATVLERDISDIVSTRLKEGNTDLLEALQAEILIKMAVRDDEAFEAVSKILKS
ncbi:hypothetical protein F4825DRAFT_406962 [Nemania diffusa]|nr:hypothetical protein F4825DRAFT_406962 [Nemania diffusa]